MVISDYKSLGVAWDINGRRKKKKARYVKGLWGRDSATVKSMEKSLSKIKG